MRKMEGSSMLEEVEIAIFSYNRAKYLKNCVDSILISMPDAIITIFDDNSDDEDTLEYLKALGDMVVYNEHDSTSRHGNLYQNMQVALENASRRFLILLQDDTQIIRSFADNDLTHIQTVFDDPNVAFLRPQLMKLGHLERFTNTLTPNLECRTYIPTAEFTDCTFGNSYCDVVVCDVQKLRQKSWQFLNSERANQIQAQKIFKYMPFMADGFVFYCPEVPCYRSKKLFIASRVVQSKLKGRISALKVMTKSKSTAFTTRDLDIWPVAETFLESTNPRVAKPFVYQDYSKSMYLLMLYKLESGLSKTTSAIRSLFQQSKI